MIRHWKFGQTNLRNLKNSWQMFKKRKVTLKESLLKHRNVLIQLKWKEKLSGKSET